MRTKTASLAGRLVAILAISGAREKAAAARTAAADWRAGRLETAGTAAPPDRPGRPDRPELRPPRDMPKRSMGEAGRVALLHALAHIELNAVDLAADIVSRFADDGLPQEFRDDWISVLDDEARHFLMLDDRLVELGARYGDLPAHDGLWQAAMNTADDLTARLAIVPLVLEARGLDVVPSMIGRLRGAGDSDSAAILKTIHQDEIRHVAIGRKWFEACCARRGVEPVETWRSLVRTHFDGVIKGPFNEQARAAAGFGAYFPSP